jgi:hypothetical protein
MTKTYIDSGFYKISNHDAKRLAKSTGNQSLPSFGHEKQVILDGQFYWLARTITWGKQVWAIRPVSNPNPWHNMVCQNTSFPHRHE